MKGHGGTRKGAGRPRKNSPLGYLRVLDDRKLGEAAKSRAAEGLASFRWDRKSRQAFLRSTGADYVALHTRTNDQLWNVRLVRLPKMAEEGDVGEAWTAYKLITARGYGSIRPRPELLARVRKLAPHAAHALWRISLAEDPRSLVYKSSSFLRIRRLARTALCKGIGIPITKQLIKVPGKGFVRLLFETFANSPPMLSPKQALVLGAWTDRDRAPLFLTALAKAGLVRIGWGRETRPE